MKRIGSKNVWVLIILMLAGIVLGGFIGTLTENMPGLSWLNYGQSFGLSIKITIASILGLLLASLIYRFI